ncbi:MAG TPA: isochorismatase family protein, partial [Thermoanaerobaculia bacterium]|nr:isochorismatase family protein [Thermoanaerobaculia bacterium]
MKPLLLLVDLQNDFLGAADLEPPPAEIVRRASRLLSGARALSVPVVHVRTEVDPGGSDRMPHWKALGRWACVRGTPGQASPLELEPEGGEAVVSKTFFSAFSTADLEPILAAAAPDTVVVAGVHLHGCVRATVLDAYQRGLTVWVADDAVGSDDPLHAAVTRRYLDQRAARFASVEDILELLSGADARRAAARELPAAVVAGRELPADGRARLLHRSPRETAAPIFAVPLAGPGEARAAAAASREALGGWWKVTAAERTRLLFDMAERVETEAGELARDMAIELGKPVSAGEAEARRAAALVRSAPSAG